MREPGILSMTESVTSRLKQTAVALKSWFQGKCIWIGNLVWNYWNIVKWQADQIKHLGLIDV